MTPQTATTKTSPAPSARAGLMLVADNPHPQDTNETKPNAGWRFTEARNSFAIANAKRPILFISEQSSKAYGQMAKYITESFPNVPFAFENDAAHKNFMINSGPYRHTINHRTIGVCEIDSDFQATMAPEFIASDCIIVMGTPNKPMIKALDEARAHNRSVIYQNSTKDTATYVPRAGVNIAQINAIVDKRKSTRSDEWLTHIRGMRPSLA